MSTETNLEELVRTLREENESLRKQIAEPDLRAFEQIRELRTTNKKLTDDMKRLTTETVQMTFKQRQLEAELREARQQSERLQGELQDARQEAERLENELRETRTHGDQLGQSIEALQSELSQSKEAMLSHEAELERQREELTRRQQQMAELQDELNTRESRISKLERLVNDLKEQYLSGELMAADEPDTAAAGAPAGSAYNVMVAHMEKLLGFAGQTVVDQVFQLSGVDPSVQDIGKIEEIFEALQDTASAFVRGTPEEGEVEETLSRCWSDIQAGTGASSSRPGLPPTATTSEPVAPEPLAPTPEPVAAPDGTPEARRTVDTSIPPITDAVLDRTIDSPIPAALPDPVPSERESSGDDAGAGRHLELDQAALGLGVAPAGEPEPLGESETFGAESAAPGGESEPTGGESDRREGDSAFTGGPQPTGGDFEPTGAGSAVAGGESARPNGEEEPASPGSGDATAADPAQAAQTSGTEPGGGISDWISSLDIGPSATPSSPALQSESESQSDETASAADTTADTSTADTGAADTAPSETGGDTAGETPDTARETTGDTTGDTVRETASDDGPAVFDLPGAQDPSSGETLSQADGHAPSESGTSVAAEAPSEDTAADDTGTTEDTATTESSTAQAETAPAETAAGEPTAAQRKTARIREAVAISASDPSAAQAQLEEILEQQDVWVEEEAEAHLALARIKAGRSDILENLLAAMPWIEVPDLFDLLPSAGESAPKTRPLIQLLTAIGTGPRADAAAQETKLGLAGRTANRDLVSKIGNEEEEQLVDILLEQLLPRSGVKIALPGEPWESRREQSSPAAFVGTLRQALRGVDYTLFDFHQLEVLSYDGEDKFLVESTVEPSLSLMFHKDVEGMAPEEVRFLAFRRLVQMYRRYTNLAQYADHIDDQARHNLLQAIIALYEEEHGELDDTLKQAAEQVQPGDADYQQKLKTLLRRLYEATEVETFLDLSDWILDQQLLQRRLNPMADLFASKVVGPTHASYATARDELIGASDAFAELERSGLQGIFLGGVGSPALRLRLQRFWAESLQALT